MNFCPEENVYRILKPIESVNWCYQHVTLLSIPFIYSLFLWFFCLCFKRQAVQNKAEIGFTFFAQGIGNLLPAILTLVLSATYLISYLTNEEFISSYFLSYSIVAFAMVLVCCLYFYDDRQYAICSSRFWFFWFLICLLMTIEVFLQIHSPENRDNQYINYNKYILVAIIISSFFNILLFSLPRKYKDVSCMHPEENASFLSQITTWWSNGLLYNGWKKSLESSDLWPLRNVYSCDRLLLSFDAAWKRLYTLYFSPQYDSQTCSKNGANYKSVDADVTVKNSPKSSKLMLCSALVSVYKGPLLAGAFFKLINDILSYLSPILLQRLLNFMASDDPAWVGFCIVAAIMLNSVILTLVLQKYFLIVSIMGMNIRTCIMDVIYRKSLTLSSQSRTQSTTGEMVNLMSVDAQRFMDLMLYINMVWSAPLQIVIALVLLYNLIGVSVFAGIIVMVIAIPINAIIANLMKKFQIRQLKRKDERIKIITEVLNGIKVLKLYAWECPFIKKISDIRAKELDILKKSGITQSVAGFFWICNPFFVSLCSFGAFVLLGNELTPEVAFVSITLFNLLRFPMSMLPHVISNVTQAYVSHSRIQRFLLLGEISPTLVNRDPDLDVALRIKDANFKWAGDEQNFQLSNISLTVPIKSLTVIVGSVGSGKSSLINAICGEMNKESGTVAVKGSTAYVGQQVWIRNATVKDNILLGKPLIEKKYMKVLEACALGPDLKILPNGDLTEIGEKGINISGGQKARISIARAVYADTDMYLFDDPIAALDAHVAKHIFTEVLGPEGILKDKARILVTNTVHFLSQCDQVVTLRKGSIAEMGAYQELMDNNGCFYEYVTNYLQEHSEESKEYEESEYNPTEFILKEDCVLGCRSNAPCVSKSALARRYSEIDVFKKSRSSLLGSGFNLEMTAIDCSLGNILNSIPIDDTEQLKEVFTKSTLRRNTSMSTGALLKKSMRDDECLRRRFKDVDFKDMLKERRVASISSEENETEDNEDKLLLDDESKDKEKSGKLTEKEHLASGQVKARIYALYFKSIGYLLSGLVLLFLVITQIIVAYNSYFLTFWTEATNKHVENVQRNITAEPVNNFYYLGIYGLIGVIYACFVLFDSAMVVYGTMNASKSLHKELLQGVLRSPMSFFEKTLTGRIINRFSKDIDAVDAILPNVIKTFLQCLLSVLTTAILISIITPLFTAILIPLLILYILILRFYVSTSRQLRRIESIARSPIYSNFGETLQGLQVIRAYREQEAFIINNRRMIDENTRCTYPSQIINRWLAIRLETLGTCIVSFAALCAILSRNSLSASLVGLSVSYALAITQVLNWLVRMSSEMENNVVAVERIKEYVDETPEAPWRISKTTPPEDWPQHGKVEFKGMSMRYRKDLPLALKQLEFTVDPGEKLGIAGRTGSGKSSLTLALFRIIEPCEGQVFIDGIDISTIGLHDLRSKLTIIPQDPVIFSGTIRENLDPFNQSSDEAVWQSLENANLAEFVRSLPSKLDFICSEGGSNIGVGQRQLICLARALLRRTKILILDEATAAIDLATDEFIQNSIRREFANCTTLTIAHRVNTILDSNRILILGEGAIKELDTPSTLIQSEGYFYSILKEMNLLPKN